MSRFAAIDFETADHGRDSACAIGMVIVNGTEVVHRHSALIRPPRRNFVFSYIHGITWQRVAKEPSFAEQWPATAKLPDVCARLGIDLDHHEALSDALACARIVIEARRAGAAV